MVHPRAKPNFPKNPNIYCIQGPRFFFSDTDAAAGATAGAATTAAASAAALVLPLFVR